MLQSPISTHKTPSSPDGKGWSFRDSTGVILRSHSLSVLQGLVDKHRFAVARINGVQVDLSQGWQLRFLDECCRQNPSAPCHPNPESPDFEPPHIAQGRALWAELHAKAETYTEPYALRDWFDGWINRAPSYHGCACRENAIQLLHQIPPDFSPEGFKPWCEKFHHAVSAKLGKKRWVPDTPSS